jgi:hypothetical protein
MFDNAIIYKQNIFMSVDKESTTKLTKVADIVIDIILDNILLHIVLILFRIRISCIVLTVKSIAL